MDMVKTHVDILFANEEEILTLFNQTDFMKTLEQLKDIVELSAITRDSRGSVIVKNRIKIFVEAEKIDEVVDSTGAGDLYAAGFLYGMSKGRSLGTCAIIGSIAASGTTVQGRKFPCADLSAINWCSTERGLKTV